MTDGVWSNSQSVLTELAALSTGSIVFLVRTNSFRNGSELEAPTKDFGPLAYYQYIHGQKQLLFAVEPSKLEFLDLLKNEFAEIFLTETKVEVRQGLYVFD